MQGLSHGALHWLKNLLNHVRQLVDDSLDNLTSELRGEIIKLVLTGSEPL